MSRQEKILEFITSHIEEKGYSPTVREIAAAVGLKSSSTAAGHLERLKDKKLIHWKPHEVRTIRILDPTNPNDPPIVLEHEQDDPVAIEWQGRRFIYDPG